VAGISHEWERRRRGSVPSAAPFDSPSLLFVLLGSASYAFHSDLQLGAPSHTLDIFFGWMLLVHLFYATCVTCATSLLSYCGARRGVLSASQASLSFCFVLLVAFVSSDYSYVYDHQLGLYFLLGVPCVVLSCICRFTLTDVDDVVSRRAIRIMAYELSVLLSLLVGAVFSQCELVGVRYPHSSHPSAYDFYHGLWHLQITTVISLLHLRLLSVAKDAERDVCVCRQSWCDFFGLLLLLSFSSLSFLLKETRVDLHVSKLLLTGVAFLLVSHAAFTTARLVAPLRPNALPTASATS